MDRPAGLAVDLSTAGVARYAFIADHRTGQLLHVGERRDSEATTLTSVFVELERQTGIALAGLPAAIAIAGVPSRSIVAVARSRWTLSRAGLDQFFGRSVSILNETAAKAWAAHGSAVTLTDLDRGTGSTAMPPLARGRRIMISLEDGLGVAIIDYAPNGLRVLDTEAGHTGFAPHGPADEALWQELRAGGRPATWERACQAAVAQPRQASSGQLLHTTQILADFTAEMMLAAGAWDGALLLGPAFERILLGSQGAAFMARLRAHRAFPRLFQGASCYLLKQTDAVLRGCARLLAEEQATGGVP